MHFVLKTIVSRWGPSWWVCSGVDFSELPCLSHLQRFVLDMHFHALPWTSMDLWSFFRLIPLALGASSSVGWGTSAKWHLAYSRTEGAQGLRFCHLGDSESLSCTLPLTFLAFGVSAPFICSPFVTFSIQPLLLRIASIDKLKSMKSQPQRASLQRASRDWA